MQTRTINETVREHLSNTGKPIHYYVEYLNRALIGLRKLSLNQNLGPNIKQVSLSISPYNRVTIPVDAIDVVSVFGLVGDKMLPFTFNERITKTYNLDGATKIPYEKGISDIQNGDTKESSVAKLGTYAVERTQVFDIADKSSCYEYNLDIENNEIVLGLGHEMQNIFVRYLSSSVSKTTANLFIEYAEGSIVAFIERETAKNDGSPQSKVAILQSAYENEKRILRSQLSNLSNENILSTLYFN